MNVVTTLLKEGAGATTGNSLRTRSSRRSKYALSYWKAFLALHVFLGTVSACRNEDYAQARGEGPGPVGSLRDLLQIVDSLRIEESPASLVVNPFVTNDSAGFLVADMSEGQIRMYERDGRVRWTAGRKGWGPGELQLPAQAISVGEDEFVVVDGKRGILQFERTADSATWRIVSTDLGRSFQSAPLGRGKVLVAGFAGHRSYSLQTPILHILDLATGTVTRSIMPMPGDELHAGTALNAGVVAFAMVADTILVTVGAVDTVYGYLLSGTRVFARGFRSEHFQTATVRLGKIPRQYWRESFTRHHKVFALSDGRVLVSHVRLWSGEHVWGTIAVDGGGRTLFDRLHREPLLAVRGDTLVFASTEDPARWYFGIIPGAEL